MPFRRRSTKKESKKYSRKRYSTKKYSRKRTARPVSRRAYSTTRTAKPRYTRTFQPRKRVMFGAVAAKAKPILKSGSGIKVLPASLGGPVDMRPGKSVTVRPKNKSGPVPDIMRTKFEWVDTRLASGPSFNYTYVGNNLVDPNQTGAGGPVNYYYPFSRLYQNFRVYASSIEVICDAENTATGETYIFVMPVMSVSSGTLPGNINDAMTFPNNKHCVIGPDTGYRSHKMVKHYCETGSLIGERDISSDPTWAGTFAGPPYTSPGVSPAQEIYWYVLALNSQSGTPVSFDLRVRITFYAELFNVVPGQQTPSPLPPLEDPTEFVEVPEENNEKKDLTDSVLITRLAGLLRS